MEDAQQGAIGGEQDDRAQAAAMSLEKRRLRLEERRLQMLCLLILTDFESFPS